MLLDAISAYLILMPVLIPVMQHFQWNPEPSTVQQRGRSGQLIAILSAPAINCLQGGKRRRVRSEHAPTDALPLAAAFDTPGSHQTPVAKQVSMQMGNIETIIALPAQQQLFLWI